MPNDFDCFFYMIDVFVSISIRRLTFARNIFCVFFFSEEILRFRLYELVTNSNASIEKGRKKIATEKSVFGFSKL